LDRQTPKKEGAKASSIGKRAGPEGNDGFLDSPAIYGGRVETSKPHLLSYIEVI